MRFSSQTAGAMSVPAVGSFKGGINVTDMLSSAPKLAVFVDLQAWVVFSVSFSNGVTWIDIGEFRIHVRDKSKCWADDHK